VAPRAFPNDTEDRLSRLSDSENPERTVILADEGSIMPLLESWALASLKWSGQVDRHASQPAITVF
jgi:hypothetical protein